MINGKHSNRVIRRLIGDVSVNRTIDRRWRYVRAGGTCNKSQFISEVKHRSRERASNNERVEKKSGRGGRVELPEARDRPRPLPA